MISGLSGSGVGLPPNGKNPLVTIYLVNREVSKDSNQQITELKIEGLKVKYRYTYGGFPGSKKEKTSFKITDKQWKKILGWIRKSGLDQPYNELNPVGRSSSSMDATFELVSEGVTVSSRVEGIPRRFIRRKKTPVRFDTSRSFFYDLETLVSFVLEMKKKK